MAERPILFSGPMVRAILEGRKTQTRRVVKEPLQFLGGRGEEAEPAQWGWAFDGPEHHGWMVLAPGFNERHDHGRVSIPCPFGVPGDRLWVRETWRAWALTGAGDIWRVEYAADGATRDLYPPSGWMCPRILTRDPLPWAPSIHMPRWASRLTLEVTGVRVERLQDISEDDARAEGVERDAKYPDRWKNYIGEVSGPDAVDSFGTLWASINGLESWDANPWVRAVSFKVLEGRAP